MKFNLLKSFDEYEIKARYIPAVIASIPLIISLSTFEKGVLVNLFKASEHFIIFENISLSVVFVIFLINIQRFIGKCVIESFLFSNELNFPTTVFLLKENRVFSAVFKEKLFKKIHKDFDINLVELSDEPEDEILRTNKDVVSLIRNKIKKGRLLHQHLIQYGFMRNLIGGLIPSLIFSLYNVYFFYQADSKGVSFIISLVVLFINSLLLILMNPVLKKLANNYASVLFTEYLNS